MAYEKSEREQEHIARSVALNNAVLTVNAVLARTDKPINTTQAGQAAKAIAEEFLKFLYTPLPAAPPPPAAPHPAAGGKNPTGSVKPGGGKEKPAPAKPKKSLEEMDPKSTQYALYSELAAGCMGDPEEMERLMRQLSVYKNFPTKGVADIPELSDGRAGSILKKLRAYLEGNPPAATAGQAPPPPDDDIPF